MKTQSLLNVKINRFYCDRAKNYILSNFTLLDGENLLFSCHALESYKDAIPTGKYYSFYSYSPKFDRDLYLLHNVQNRTGIRIHTGNTSKDTKGCIILGAHATEDFVWRSIYIHNEFIRHTKGKSLKIQIS